MRTRLFGLATLLITLTASWPPAVETAQAGCPLGEIGHGHGCHAAECPRCHCKISIEQVKEKKTSFDVTCKPICIPRITLPWQKCCAPKCARIKYVHVVKKVTYECKKCKYKFEPVCCDACSGCATEEEGAPYDQPVAPPAPTSPHSASLPSYFRQADR